MLQVDVPTQIGAPGIKGDGFQGFSSVNLDISIGAWKPCAMTTLDSRMVTFLANEAFVVIVTLSSLFPYIPSHNHILITPNTEHGIPLYTTS
jgi:hypothetical protein